MHIFAIHILCLMCLREGMTSLVDPQASIGDNRPIYSSGNCYGPPNNDCENNICHCSSNSFICFKQDGVMYGVCSQKCNRTADCPAYPYDPYKVHCSPLGRCHIACSFSAHCPRNAVCGYPPDSDNERLTVCVYKA